MMSTTTQSIPTFDQNQSDAFADRMVGMLNESALSMMVSIGHRTGLFDTGMFSDHLDVVEKLNEIAGKQGVPLAHLAIRWLLSHTAVSAVIAGAKRPDQVEQNSQAVGWNLTADKVKQINALTS